MKRVVVVLFVACALFVGRSALCSERSGGHDWETLNRRACPAWWTDAKFGIFIFWGVYSVPAYAPTKSASVYDCYAEHYWRFLDRKKKKDFKDYHEKHFPGKSYRDLAAEFKAEDFDPDVWADVFQRSGAKYVVLASKHHDGYALWPSKYAANWNSSAIGPKRDLCGELTEAVRAKGMRMGFYYSLLEWFHPLYNDKDMTSFVDQVNFPQMRELVESYRPDVFYADGEWDYPWQTFRSTEFLAWLFNESPVAATVVVNDRWGKGMRGKCGDYWTTEYDLVEDANGDVGALSRHPWEECRGIGRSFGYNRFERAEDYASVADCIETLVDKVSNGGNLLLDVGPDAHGRIPPIMEDRLLAIGRWLKVNGEAIYGTQVWRHRPADMRKSHVYFTTKGNSLYVIATRWPQAPLRIDSLTGARAVSFLGSEAKVDWRESDGGTVITPPSVNPGMLPCDSAWVFKVEL